ncbi:hypothetical protein [Thomasclavelia sp.]|uniref:hypothetical protein n=1 Tax=Thomasclavelia sp. TaxID=3025757 RepID=UPI0025FAEF65|nr:hypothetical protein [Thomasclavelia sp.]
MVDNIKLDPVELAKDFFADRDKGLNEGKLLNLVAVICKPKLVKLQQENPHMETSLFEVALEKTQIRVLKRYVIYFIKRDLEHDNYDPVEFVKWLHIVCKNTIQNYLKSKNNTLVLSIGKADDHGRKTWELPDKSINTNNGQLTSYQYQMIDDAFHIVFDLPNIHTVLIWLYYMMMLSEKGENRKSVLTRMNDSKDMTLMEVYDYVVIELKKYYQFISFTKEDEEKLFKKISQYYGDKPYSKYKIKDFYTNNKYAITKEISDVNRRKIRSKIKEEG